MVLNTLYYRTLNSSNDDKYYDVVAIPSRVSLLKLGVICGPETLQIGKESIEFSKMYRKSV